MIFHRFEGVGKRFQGVGWCFQGVSMCFEACLKGFEGRQCILDDFNHPPPKLVEVGPDLSRSVLELFEDSDPSIEGEATQIARNLPDLCIQLGRQPCLGRVPSEIFWCKDRGASRSFIAFSYACAHLFGIARQANKCTLVSARHTHRSCTDCCDFCTP